MTDGIPMKGKQIILLFVLHNQILEQLTSNHRGKEETRLLARQVVYLINMNAHIENTMRQ